MSREKAQVHRPAVVVILMEQKRATNRTKIMRTIEAAGEPVTTWMIYGRAWPYGAAMMSARGGRVKQIGTVNTSAERRLQQALD